MMKSLLSGYEREKFKLEDDLSALRVEKMKAESQTADITEEINNLKQYVDITELNRTIVTSLIQSIHISKPKKSGKEKTYDIEIRYKFQNTLRTKKEIPFADEISTELRKAVSF